MIIAMSIIMSEVNSECSRLREYTQKTAAKSPFPDRRLPRVTCSVAALVCFEEAA